MGIDEKLDISDLVLSVGHFQDSLARTLEIEQMEINGLEPFIPFEMARSAVIQNYNTAVEACWKMMQRWIRINADNMIHQKPKRELFRTAHQCGLIDDPAQWWGFYEGRNRVAHTYFEPVAVEVWQLAKNFDTAAPEFLKRLEQRL